MTMKKRYWAILVVLFLIGLDWSIRARLVVRSVKRIAVRGEPFDLAQDRLVEPHFSGLTGLRQAQAERSGGNRFDETHYQNDRGASADRCRRWRSGPRQTCRRR
jgi:hypothetical protein